MKPAQLALKVPKAFKARLVTPAQLVPRAWSRGQQAQQVRKVFKVKPAQLVRKVRKAFKA